METSFVVVVDVMQLH